MTHMAFGQIISFGGCGAFFCSFACFHAKDRSALCWILFGIERSQFCAAGPSRMLSIGFGSSRVPFRQGCLQVDVFTPRDATEHWDVFVEGQGGFDNMPGTFQVSHTVNCSKRWSGTYCVWYSYVSSFHHTFYGWKKPPRKPIQYDTIWLYIYFTQCIWNVQSTPDHDLGSVINLYVYIDTHFTMYLFCFTK